MADGSEVKLAFDRAARDLMHRIRWRRVPDEPLRRNVALLVAALLHIGFLAALYYGTGPDRPAADAWAGIEVVLLPPRLPAPPPVPMAVEPKVVRTPTVIPRVASAPATRAPAAAPPASSSPILAPPPSKQADPASHRLFNPDGSLRLAPNAAAAPAPLFRPRSVSSPELMTHSSPIPYKATRFESAWVSVNETAGGEFFRRHVVKAKKFKTPWGTTISCGWALFLGGCSWGAAPKPLVDPPRMPWENYVEEPPKRW